MREERQKLKSGKSITLEQYSKEILRVSVLNSLGLPDTLEGNQVLDLLVNLAVQNDAIEENLADEYDDWERHS